MNNILKIVAKLPNIQQLHFQFGKHFNCTDTIKDIDADTAIIDIEEYLQHQKDIKHMVLNVWNKVKISRKSNKKTVVMNSNR